MSSEMICWCGHHKRYPSLMAQYIARILIPLGALMKYLVRSVGNWRFRL